MTEDADPGLGDASGSGGSDPRSLWPLVDGLTATLAEDVRLRVNAAIGDASHELALTRVSLNTDPVTVTADRRDAGARWSAIEGIVRRYQSDIDRLESQIQRDQQAIAELGLQLLQSPVPHSPRLAGQPAPLSPDAVEVPQGPEPRSDVIMPVVSGPPAPESVPANTPSDQAGGPATPSPLRHRASWKANVLVGTVTLMVVIVVLVILGAL